MNGPNREKAMPPGELDEIDHDECEIEYEEDGIEFSVVRYECWD